jgi:hypothetical protein
MDCHLILPSGCIGFLWIRDVPEQQIFCFHIPRPGLMSLFQKAGSQ